MAAPLIMYKLDTLYLSRLYAVNSRPETKFAWQGVPWKSGCHGQFALSTAKVHSSGPGAVRMEQSRRLRRRKSHRRKQDPFRVRRRFWELPLASRKRSAIIGFIIGLVLGCLLGATLTFLPRAGNAPAAGVDVNERTGKTQIHLQGQPDIK